MLRSLLRNPGFSIPAAGILALGFAAMLAVLEAADTILVRPLPYSDPDRLVTAWQLSGGTRITVDGADFLDWKAQADGLRHMSAVSARGFTLTGADRPERIEGAIVSADFFLLLGTQPLLGRAPVPGPQRTAVLSESLWRSRFAADPAVIGRTITLDGEPIAIAGVMPAPFAYPPLAQVWVSAKTRVPEHPTYPIDPEHDRERHYLTVLARLGRGVSFAEGE